MKITRIRFEKVTGRIDEELPREEEGQVWALNVYEEHRLRAVSYPHPVDRDHPRPIEQLLLLVDTDEGITGQAQVFDQIAVMVHSGMRQYLEGSDPLATERTWDILKRSNRGGHRGGWIAAIAAVDHALWDIRGKAAGLPVHRLLGGPTRSGVPAYASTLGCSLEPQRVFERARAFRGEGFFGQKWFFKHGPGDGPEGQAANLLLVRTLREALGDDYPLMFDCFMGWDVPYAIEMCRRMERYNPRWLEEPLQPDRAPGIAEIRRRTGVPIAAGEHEHTRWGFRELLEVGGVDVLQPDPYGVGGISEMVKVAALGSAWDRIVVPHAGGVEFAASQPPSTCPCVEYLHTWWKHGQWLRKYPTRVERGMVFPTEQPGLGNELDPARVLGREEWVPA